MPYYIQNEQGEPVLCADVALWLHWFKTADRLVAESGAGDVTVRTEFVGLDHMIYATTVFGGPYHDRQWLHATRGAAEDAHDAIADEVLSGN